MHFVVAYRATSYSWVDPAFRVDSCRAAGVQFLEGIVRGWDKRDLAEWLSGPYRKATQHRGERETDPQRFAGVDLTARIDDIMLAARLEVMTALASSTIPGGSIAFVEDAIRSGGITLERGREDGAWIPVDKLRMRLADRVLSLFAADYLVRPVDYVTELVACLACGTVVFDADVRAAGGCNAHRHPSGFDFTGA